MVLVLRPHRIPNSGRRYIAMLEFKTDWKKLIEKPVSITETKENMLGDSPDPSGKNPGNKIHLQGLFCLENQVENQHRK